MFSLLRRLASVSHSVTQQQLRYANFTIRDILHESADESGTLLMRFAKHIAIDRHTDEQHVLPETKIRYSDYFPITDDRFFRHTVQTTPGTQLPALIIYSSSYRPNAPPPKYAMVLNALDARALEELPNMDISTVLETLYSFLFVIPNWLKRVDFYYAAIRRLASEDLILSKQRFVQLCYYVGLQKKQQTAPNLSTLLTKLLPQHLDSLNVLDLALISSATYKTSTLVTGDVRDSYESDLVDSILKLPTTPENEALLVCFIKALRFQRVYDERICQHLVDICLDPQKLQSLQPRGLTHVFAYLSEHLWDHSECSKNVVEQLMKMVMKPGLLRSKDLATFLWCCAQLDCSLTPLQMKQLEVAAFRMLDAGEYNNYPDILVDTCLSLCMLGLYFKPLIDATEELKATQHRQRPQPKVESRLIVLHSALAIEHPSWIDVTSQEVFNNVTEAPAFLMKERKYWNDCAMKLSLNYQLNSVNYICPIKGINLPSMRLSTTNKETDTYYIDLLSSNQVLKFSKKPIALVRLKRRLLETLGHNVLLQLDSGDVTDNVSAIQKHLKGSLALEEAAQKTNN